MVSVILWFLHPTLMRNVSEISSWHSWFQITYGWRVSDNRQCGSRQKETRVYSLHRNTPLISPHSTFTVDFKGLQHPLCPRALGVQKETSELYINRSAGLVNLSLYPHHEQHAKHHNKDHFKLHYMWVFCNQFEDVLWLNWLSYSHLFLPFTSLLTDWLVDPGCHQRAAVKPIKRWISATIYPGPLRLADKSSFTGGHL